MSRGPMDSGQHTVLDSAQWAVVLPASTPDGATFEQAYQGLKKIDGKLEKVLRLLAAECSQSTPPKPRLDG